MIDKETGRYNRNGDVQLRTSLRMKSLTFLYNVGQLGSHFGSQDPCGWGYRACITAQLSPLPNPTSFPSVPQMLIQSRICIPENPTCRRGGVKMGVEAIKLRGQLDVELKERKEFEDSKSSGWCWVIYGTANSSGSHPKIIEEWVLVKVPMGHFCKSYALCIWLAEHG